MRDLTRRRIAAAMRMREDEHKTNAEIAEALRCSVAAASYYARGMSTTGERLSDAAPGAREWTTERLARALRALADAVESGEWSGNAGARASMGRSVERKLGRKV